MTRWVKSARQSKSAERGTASQKLLEHFDDMIVDRVLSKLLLRLAGETVASSDIHGWSVQEAAGSFQLLVAGLLPSDSKGRRTDGIHLLRWQKQKRRRRSCRFDRLLLEL